jgi:hypothetical protein
MTVRRIVMANDPGAVFAFQTVQPPEPFGDRPAPMARAILGASGYRSFTDAQTVRRIVMVDDPATVDTPFPDRPAL